MLPFSQLSYSGADVLIRGIELGCVNVPLHNVHLCSDLISGLVRLGVREQILVEGVSLIILAGGKVFPFLVVTTNTEPGDQT